MRSETEELLTQVTLRGKAENQPVELLNLPHQMEIVGIGTDGAVLRIKGEEQRVYKFFPDDRLNKLDQEYAVYQKLGGNHFFSKCLGKGHNYLILSYEEGPTLYQCLEKGILIPKQVIQDVEDARDFVRQQGLNPRDIHLKNVILQSGRAKLIDVADYTKSGDDGRWDHLREGYEKYYHLIREKTIPLWVLDLVRRRYLSQEKGFSIPSFVEEMLETISNGKR